MSMKDEQVKEITLRSKGYIFYIVVFMGLVGLMDQYLSMIESVAIIYILDEFELERHEFAFWQGIFGILTFAVFLLSWFSDAYGRRKSILVLICLMGITVLLIPLLAYNFWIFIVLYSIVILGTLSNIWEIPIMEESPPEKRATYGSIAFLIGVIPLFAILGPIVAVNWGWRWCYGVMFFMMIGLLILWLFMKEPERWKAEHEKRGHKMYKFKETIKVLTKKDRNYIILASLAYLIWNIVYKLTLTFAGSYFVDILGYSMEQYFYYLLFGAIFIPIGAITSGILMDKIGRTPILLIGIVGSSIAYIGLGITKNPYCFVFIFFFMSIVFAWILVYFSEIFPTEVRGTCLGITTTVARAGYVIGPLIGYLLLITFPTMEGFWIILSLFMLIPLLSLIIKPLETKGRTLEEIQNDR